MRTSPNAATRGTEIKEEKLHTFRRPQIGTETKNKKLLTLRRPQIHKDP